MVLSSVTYVSHLLALDKTAKICYFRNNKEHYNKIGGIMKTRPTGRPSSAAKELEKAFKQLDERVDHLSHLSGPNDLSRYLWSQVRNIQEERRRGLDHFSQALEFLKGVDIRLIPLRELEKMILLARENNVIRWNREFFVHNVVEYFFIKPEEIFWKYKGRIVIFRQNKYSKEMDYLFSRVKYFLTLAKNILALSKLRNQYREDMRRFEKTHGKMRFEKPQKSIRKQIETIEKKIQKEKTDTETVAGLEAKIIKTGQKKNGFKNVNRREFKEGGKPKEIYSRKNKNYQE